ncbi:MAG TPA: hypothetical protein K8V27_03210 [Butyricicoccus pullicaecorum]|nr:hypothetical protein [Butyricicoccus pullicaecorum]
MDKNDAGNQRKSDRYLCGSSGFQKCNTQFADTLPFLWRAFGTNACCHRANKWYNIRRKRLRIVQLGTANAAGAGYGGAIWRN